MITETEEKWLVSSYCLKTQGWMSSLFKIEQWF